jgi:hypothetical protein
MVKMDEKVLEAFADRVVDVCNGNREHEFVMRPVTASEALKAVEDLLSVVGDEFAMKPEVVRDILLSRRGRSYFEVAHGAVAQLLAEVLDSRTRLIDAVTQIERVDGKTATVTMTFEGSEALALASLASRIDLSVLLRDAFGEFVKERVPVGTYIASRYPGESKGYSRAFLASKTREVQARIELAILLSSSPVTVEFDFDTSKAAL